jgi:putative inorganic carbon (HCO3(-)) transporter
LFAAPDAYWTRIHSIQTYEEEQDESALGRLHFWKVAVEMANRNPLLGVGYQGYNLSYNHYDFSHGTYGVDRSVHSSLFGALAELGYLGAFMFAIVIFNALRSCSRVRKLALKEAALVRTDKAAVGLQTSLVAFLVGGSFVIFQYNEMLWNIIGLTIALEQIATRHQREIASDKLSGSSIHTGPNKGRAAA